MERIKVTVTTQGAYFFQYYSEKCLTKNDKTLSTQLYISFMMQHLEAFKQFLEIENSPTTHHCISAYSSMTPIDKSWVAAEFKNMICIGGACVCLTVTKHV